MEIEVSLFDAFHSRISQIQICICGFHLTKRTFAFSSLTFCPVPRQQNDLALLGMYQNCMTMHHLHCVREQLLVKIIYILQNEVVAGLRPEVFSQSASC